MRFVTVKTTMHQEIQAVHRVRFDLMEQRTANGNQTRRLVAKLGLMAPQELSTLRGSTPARLEDTDNGLGTGFRQLLAGLWRD